MRGLLMLSVAVLASGCTTGYFRDRTMEYGKAVSTPPLVLPEGDTRPQRPLYPIPALTEATRPSDKPFVVPYPPAMVQVKSVEQQALPDTKGRLVVKLGTDGNGVPELRVIGPRERVWDELGQTLAALAVTVKDRNQSLGLVDVVIDQKPYQVRMVRGAEAFVINLQRDENTLAPIGTARTLLNNLQVRWP